MQGVAFRHHTKLRARELGLTGWVRNRPDGSVEVWFEGDDGDVEELARWLASGPSLARVDRVESRDVEPAGHARFVVRFDEEETPETRAEPRPDGGRGSAPDA